MPTESLPRRLWAAIARTTPGVDGDSPASSGASDHLRSAVARTPEATGMAKARSLMTEDHADYERTVDLALNDPELHAMMEARNCPLSPEQLRTMAMNATALITAPAATEYRAYVTLRERERVAQGRAELSEETAGRGRRSHSRGSVSRARRCLVRAAPRLGIRPASRQFLECLGPPDHRRLDIRCPHRCQYRDCFCRPATDGVAQCGRIGGVDFGGSRSGEGGLAGGTAGTGHQSVPPCGRRPGHVALFPASRGRRLSEPTASNRAARPRPSQPSRRW